MTTPPERRGTRWFVCHLAGIGTLGIVTALGFLVASSVGWDSTFDTPAGRDGTLGVGLGLLAFAVFLLILRDAE